MARSRANPPEAYVEGDDSRTFDEVLSISEASPPPTPEPYVSSIPEQPPSSADTVTVLLLCDHVYLPEDPTIEDWQAARVTVRYDGKVDGRRQRIVCHPSLAEFLQERGQAEMLD